MAATCLVHPTDVVKNRMQMNKSGTTILKTIGDVACEGHLRFYDGLSAGLLRQATYTTARLGIYNQLQDLHRFSSGQAIHKDFVEICNFD